MMPMNQLADRALLALLSSQRHSWEQGVAMQAVMDLRRMDLLIPMAYECANRIRPDGRIASMGDEHACTDPASCGLPLMVAARETSEPFLFWALHRLLRYILEDAPRAGDGTVFHLDHSHEIWADSAYMLPPFLAAMGYADEACRQYWGIVHRLQNEQGLIRHIWNEDQAQATDPALWGVGNGWVLAGTVRLLQQLPEDREDLASPLRLELLQLLQVLLSHLPENRLFHNILDDEHSFQETNLTQMVAWSILCATKHRFLDTSYLKTAHALADAVAPHVDRYGILHDACGAPRFDRAGMAPEAQAFLVMLLSELDAESQGLHS